MKIASLAFVFAAVNIGSDVSAAHGPGLRAVVGPGVALSDGFDGPLEKLVKFERLLATDDEEKKFMSEVKKVPPAKECKDFFTLLAAVVRPPGQEHENPPPEDKILRMKVCKSELHGTFDRLMGAEERTDIKEDRWQNSRQFSSVALVAFVGDVADEHIKLLPEDILRIEKYLVTPDELSLFVYEVSKDKEVCEGTHLDVSAGEVGKLEPPMKSQVCEKGVMLELSTLLEAAELKEIEEKRWENRENYILGEIVVTVVPDKPNLL